MQGGEIGEEGTHGNLLPIPQVSWVKQGLGPQGLPSLEGKGTVVAYIPRLDQVQIYQVGFVAVEENAECHPVPPALSQSNILQAGIVLYSPGGPALESFSPCDSHA